MLAWLGWWLNESKSYKNSALQAFQSCVPSTNLYFTSHSSIFMVWHDDDDDVLYNFFVGTRG